MDTDKIIEMVWDNLLEPMPKQFGDSFRTLTCGCIVWRDGEYLDLYQYRNNVGPCDAGYAHEVPLAARAVADGYDPQGERMTVAVAGYTDGWDEEGEALREMFRAAVQGVGGSTCPRCGGQYPTGTHALSRHDSRTRVCSPCGADEAVIQFQANRARMGAGKRAVDPVLGRVPWVSPESVVH